MGWKFLCDSETEKECLIRRLFGNNEELGEISEGETLFLHNRDSDYLMGPFLAAGESDTDIVLTAWEGRFPWQVEVTWEEPIYGLSIAVAKQFSDEQLAVNIHGGFQSLGDDDTEELIHILHNHEKSQRIVTPR